MTALEQTPLELAKAMVAYIDREGMDTGSPARRVGGSAEGRMNECRCVPCGECMGSGTIWLDFRGRYLGSSRCDDMDELDTCDGCSGRGITEVCESCMDADEDRK